MSSSSTRELAFVVLSLLLFLLLVLLAVLGRHFITLKRVLLLFYFRDGELVIFLSFLLLLNAILLVVFGVDLLWDVLVVGEAGNFVLAVKDFFLQVDSLQVERKIADLSASEQPSFRHQFLLIYKSIYAAFWLRVGDSRLINHILDVLTLAALAFIHTCKTLSNPQGWQFSFFLREEQVCPFREKAMDAIEAEYLLAGKAGERFLCPYYLLADVARLHQLCKIYQINLK